MAILAGVMLIIGAARAQDRVVLSPDGDVGYMPDTRDECGAVEIIDMQESNAKIELPPDFFTNSWDDDYNPVTRKEFEALKDRVKALEVDKIPHIDLLASLVSATEDDHICPKCGAIMVKKYQGIILTSNPPQAPWNWWCGCGYTEPTQYDVGPGETDIMDVWKDRNHKKGDK